MLQKINGFFNTYEKIWIVSIIIVTIYIGGGMDDKLQNFIALSSFISGAIFVLLCAKGSLWNYPFGIYNAISYSYVMFEVKEFGNFYLYLAFFLPMLIIGWFAWYKNHKKSKVDEKEGFEVEAKTLSTFGWILIVFGIIIITFLVKIYLFKYFGSDEKHIWLDSFAVATPLVAQLLMNLRYTQQWHLWTLVNIANIILWGTVYFESGGSLANLVSWSFFLLNSIYGIMLWKKHEVKK